MERKRPIRRGIRRHSFLQERGHLSPGEKWVSVFVAFGPFYRGHDMRVSIEAKDETWKHVLGSRETQKSETTHRYVTAMKEIETQVRSLYAEDESIKQLSSDSFVWMMIKDGCFMLMVVLFALGAKKQLNCPPQDHVFGTRRDKDILNVAIASMFCVGNQIPLIVLWKLMKQSYFQRVLKSRKWKQPMDLQRRVFYEFLVVPVLNPSGGFLQGLFQIVGRTRRDKIRETPDILHGLWLLLTGQANYPTVDDGIGSDDEDDNEYGRVPSVIPSATQLQQAGISFKDNKGRGITGINFNKNMFNAVLNLPSVLINRCYVTMLENLINYEFTHQVDERRRHVCAYIQLLEELVRVQSDATILITHGIINAELGWEEWLPETLSQISPAEVKNDRYLRITRQEIITYSQSHWKKLGNFLSIVLVLTVVQTIYTAMAYYQNRK